MIALLQLVSPFANCPLLFSTFNSPPLVQTPVLLAKDIAELGEGRLGGDVAAGDHLLDWPSAQLILGVLCFLSVSEGLAPQCQ